MKNSLSKSRLIQFLVVVVAMGFLSGAQADVVQMRLNDAQNALDVTTQGKCSSNNHNGCLEVAKGKKATINMVLIGDKNCNRQANAKWEMGEVYLGGKGSMSKPGSWGGLDAQVQADFIVADTASGRLNKESGSNKNSIAIKDDNNNAYDIWYKVTVVCKGSDGSVIGAPVETDPRIKNGGR